MDPQKRKERERMLLGEFGGAPAAEGEDVEAGGGDSGRR
jgi:hypothetical protein